MRFIDGALIATSTILASVCLGLYLTTPDEGLLMVGSLSSVEAQALAALTAAAATLILLMRRLHAITTDLGLRVLALVGQVGLVAAWSVVASSCIVVYAAQPERSFLEVGPDRFVILSAEGPLIASEATNLRLLIKQGDVYLPTAVTLPTAETATYRRAGFIVAKGQETTTLTYRATGGAIARVELP